MPFQLEYSQITGECGDLLDKYFITGFRTGYVRVKGVVLPEYFKIFGDKILNMNVRDDDIWVCSFPKTGTTWTQEMVWCIANNLDFEGAKVNLPRRFPFLEHTILFDYRGMSPKLPNLQLPEYVTDALGYIDRMPSPRFIKSHLPFELLPLEIQEGKKNAKIIYTARSAKDTCLSYYHHCQLMEGYKGSFDDFAKLFINDSLCFAPFWENILSYWNKRDDPNILFLKFEDLKTDLTSVIKETAKFLNKKLTTEQLEILCKHLSFESMKNNPAVNYEDVIEINRKYKLIETEGNFMRSGQVGEWKQKMTQEWVEKFDKWSRDKLEATGLTL